MHLRKAIWALALSAVTLSAARADDFKLKIIAFNDFHGNLQSPGKFKASPTTAEVDVGGIDYLAGYIDHLRNENPNHIVVSAGDLFGASPLVSNLFHDEGTIEAMNRLGLDLNAVGNHEFDKGKQELLRMQNGGCSKRDQNTCKGATVGTTMPFEGAKFQFLAANVFDTATGKTLFPPYAIKMYEGVPVAFIGLTLKEAPTVITPSGVAGLRFADEATTINGIVHQLRAQGIEAFVVLIHQGGLQKTTGTPDINACDGGLDGSRIKTIVGKLDDGVDLVISGHTHAAYICRLANSAGRNIPVTSAASFGRVLTEIDVTIDKNTKDIAAVSARNIAVERKNTGGIVPDVTLKNITDECRAGPERSR